MARHVVDLALDPDVSATRITNVVSKDPVLATRVIQLANSAFSAPATEITSIGEAVVRMGTGPVRNVVTAACLSALSADPKIYGRHGRDHIDHSIGTAYLAWLLADRADESPDEAFLYGLLHDIGKLVILKLARDCRKFLACWRRPRKKPRRSCAKSTRRSAGECCSSGACRTASSIRSSGTTIRLARRSAGRQRPSPTWQTASRTATASAAPSRCVRPVDRPAHCRVRHGRAGHREARSPRAGPLRGRAENRRMIASRDSRNHGSTNHIAL